MSTQSYNRIVADVRHICMTLSLQLPTHAKAIESQRRNIRRICQQLETIQRKVRVLSIRSWNPAQREEYRVLNQLLSQLITETINMVLLAEEFPSDPEGSVGCLQEVNRRKNQLLQQLTVLEHEQQQGYLPQRPVLRSLEPITPSTKLPTA